MNTVQIARNRQVKSSQVPRVMIVEDEDAIVMALRYNLEAAGYEIEACGRGDEAEIRLQEELPDLLLLDWALPGVSGIELCRRLRARPQSEQLPIGLLFPAKRSNGRVKPTAVYKFTKVNGKTKRVKVGHAIRHVRSVSSFDYALNKAVERIILAPPDSYYDQMIEAIPEISQIGRKAFHGVSSHSFRCSMAMYIFYTLEWDAAICMGVTGHESLDAFYQYIDYKTDRLAEMMQAI